MVELFYLSGFQTRAFGLSEGWKNVANGFDGNLNRPKILRV
jgi:hypothetical protein